MKFNTKPTEEKMQKSVASYESNLSTIRASQANSAVISKVTFEYYGTPTKIVDMAAVVVSDPKTLTISPYDRSTLKAMVKAIEKTRTEKTLDDLKRDKAEREREMIRRNKAEAAKKRAEEEEAERKAREEAEAAGLS